MVILTPLEPALAHKRAHPTETIRSIARAFGVPKSTLYARLSGKHSAHGYDPMANIANKAAKDQAEARAAYPAAAAVVSAAARAYVNAAVAQAEARRAAAARAEMGPRRSKRIKLARSTRTNTSSGSGTRARTNANTNTNTSIKEAETPPVLEMQAEKPAWDLPAPRGMTTAMINAVLDECEDRPDVQAVIHDINLEEIEQLLDEIDTWMAKTARLKARNAHLEATLERCEAERAAACAAWAAEDEDESEDESDLQSEPEVGVPAPVGG